MKRLALVGLAIALFAIASQNAHATTKGLSQIVTPELQAPGDLSLSFQAQDEQIGKPSQPSTLQTTVHTKFSGMLSSPTRFTCGRRGKLFSSLPTPNNASTS